MATVTKRIGLLTSGGDAPGMNAAIRAVVRQGIALGAEVIGIRRGYCGLIEGELLPLGIADVSEIMDRGGTVLESSRCEQFLQEEGQARALRTAERAKLDGLVVIGGDGSLRGAWALQERGLPVMGIPATIDNDIWGTSIAIGVDTALNTVVECLRKIRDTAISHERAFVVETMGRESGYLALMGGLAGGAEAILIPEVPVDLGEVVEVVRRGYQRGKRHAIIVVAEGVFANAAQVVAAHIRERLGLTVRVTVLGHLQRGGSPTAFDRILGSRLGAEAVRRLVAGESGRMVGLAGDELQSVPLAEVAARRRQLDLELYELAMVLSR